MSRNSPLDNMAMQKQQVETAYAGQLGGSSYQPTLRERLTSQQQSLTKKLADIEAAIEALDKNPNFEEVLDVIGKAQY